MSEPRHHTRAVVVPLDPSAHQERLLSQYCGARRFAYNWALGVVLDNLDVRRSERAAGVTGLTPPVLWSAYSLNRMFNQAKGTDVVAGLRPETVNADPRSCETATPSGVEAGVVRGRNQAAAAPVGAAA